MPRNASLELRLERTLQQAMLARAVADDKAELADAARTALAHTERELGEHPRMERLARRVSLLPEQQELVWAIVACSLDGRIVPHLQTLGGGHARRGLSLAVYAMLADLHDGTTARLARWLTTGNRLIGDGLLIETEDVSPASRAYVASPRLVNFLSGDDALPPSLTLAKVPDDVLHDARQSAAITRISSVLEPDAHPIVIIEGPHGSGRATACACATSAQLIVLDLARIAASSLAEALVACRRECLLRDAVPVLANVDLVLGDERHAERQLLGSFIDSLDGALIATPGRPGEGGRGR